MAEIGDKFTIEIGSKFCNSANETLYRIKGFNSLVFDENGISKLTPYKEHGDPSFDLHVGDQFVLNGTGKAYIIITKIDNLNNNVHALWNDGSADKIKFEFLFDNFKKTDFNHSYALDVVFGKLPY